MKEDNVKSIIITLKIMQHIRVYHGMLESLNIGSVTNIYQLLTKTTNEHQKANQLRNSPMVGMVVTISPSLSL
nr:hypothetical protein CFP56_35382 [Quercus suber]